MKPVRITPHPEKLHVWEHYARELLVECRQCDEEGLDVAALKPMMEAVQAMPDSEYRERFADIIAEMVLNLPMREDYPFDEPSDIEAIRTHRDGRLCRRHDEGRILHRGAVEGTRARQAAHRNLRHGMRYC